MTQEEVGYAETFVVAIMAAILLPPGSPFTNGRRKRAVAEAREILDEAYAQQSGSLVRPDYAEAKS